MSVADCWLGYRPTAGVSAQLAGTGARVALAGGSELLRTARDELVAGLAGLTGTEPAVVPGDCAGPHILIAGPGSAAASEGQAGAPAADGAAESFEITGHAGPPARIVITGSTDAACLHGVFAFLRRLQAGPALGDVSRLAVTEQTATPLRLLSHWDNLDGSVERGYAGSSVFFAGGKVTADLRRVEQYARLVASVGVNAVCVNNVNVTREAARLLTGEHLPALAQVAGIFRRYGIALFLSVSFDSPVVLSGVRTADPLDPAVAAWWQRQAAQVYGWIPDLGGFMVKADSESRPGPAVYGRTQAEGANMLARAVAPFRGTVLWRAFVYDCWQDWRDRRTDRARACYDTFQPLDGEFDPNVILQVKNGPVDFQVREPDAPLLSALRATRTALEVQVTQEYTGQQIDLCFLAPQWHEVLSAQVDAPGGGTTTLARLLTERGSAVTGVANVGDDPSWTGHVLAQANLYAFGRLAWDPQVDPAEVAAEWAARTFGAGPAAQKVAGMLTQSWQVYENYTAPLGVGWMVTPGTHYGPDIDGYEYSRWGTYHYADRDGVGVDRTEATGTGYTAQYGARRAALFEDLKTCPDELLLFFHHVPYGHRLHSGKTVIQHIYDSHFDGADGARRLLGTWQELEGQVDPVRHELVRRKLELQVANAKEWRDIVNSYFFRKSGVPDDRDRTIY